MKHDGDFELAIAAHDAAVSRLGIDIWLGNEPTFTDRYSIASEWVTAALGGDKKTRAERLLSHLASEHPGCAVLRTIGRQYPGEPSPRWSLGLYGRRSGQGLWLGPPDPLLSHAAIGGETDLSAFRSYLEGSFTRCGFPCVAFRSEGEWRIVVARDRSVRLPPSLGDARLWRPSIHDGAIPDTGLHDGLAAEGIHLLIVSSVNEAGREVPCVELPTFGAVRLFVAFLGCISEAARALNLHSLVLRGFAPPVDESVLWTTITPDPAVVEVNMAPHPSVLGFLRDNRRAYTAAAAVGLAPYRLHYNGTVADSGGGGQITFGGSCPERSPFLVQPHLLPRLLRYAQRHPSLSYFFAHDYIGGSGQSVRPDEHGMDAFNELKLALALIEGEESPDPTTLWLALAPSLTDPVGNAHRAEINVEKLWNAYQPGRGQLGLVEFRAFRMQHTPERAAALAAMLRAILAMLMTRDDESDLVNWGATLHDRFALPFYLEADLRGIFADLEAAGLPLAPLLRAELRADQGDFWTSIDCGEVTLTVRRAREFWPLVGDASVQHGTSRLVDASSSRIELSIRPKASDRIAALEALQLRACGIELPLRTESDERGPVRLLGLRYRSFVPTRGLHPTLGSQAPLRLHLVDPSQSDALEITIHEWRPDGIAYDGLPPDLAQAAARRTARCTSRRLRATEVGLGVKPPRGAVADCTLDLRYLPVAARLAARAPASGEALKSARGEEPAPALDAQTPGAIAYAAGGSS
ncbi:MAG TPA: transglutaminase family protein [Polyangiaceae bacterium]|nr:transglutaminase family protein [Polyangiaceae bacterium]